MRKLDFGSKWMFWMETGLFSSSMFVLINRSLTKDFVVGRGLRQGDALSPFLFAIVVEGLAGLVKQTTSSGLFKGFEMTQFDDDTILVGEATWSNLWDIKSILRGFEMISRLRINVWKRKIYGIGARENFLQDAYYYLICKIDCIPFKFLGILIGANHRRIDSWRARLTGWKGRMLSLVDKATLINSVINNLHVHHLSFYKVLVKVLHEVIRIQRNFVWHGSASGKGICWIKWSKVCKSEAEGKGGSWY